MTQEQREKLFEIMGQIEGLGWGVENQQISEGFCDVVEDLAKLLEDDGMTGDKFIGKFLKEDCNGV